MAINSVVVFLASLFFAVSAISPASSTDTVTYEECDDMRWISREVCTGATTCNETNTNTIYNENMTEYGAYLLGQKSSWETPLLIENIPLCDLIYNNYTADYYEIEFCIGVRYNITVWLPEYVDFDRNVVKEFPTEEGAADTVDVNLLDMSGNIVQEAKSLKGLADFDYKIIYGTGSRATGFLAVSHTRVRTHALSLKYDHFLPNVSVSEDFLSHYYRYSIKIEKTDGSCLSSYDGPGDDSSVYRPMNQVLDPDDYPYIGGDQSVQRTINTSVTTTKTAYIGLRMLRDTTYRIRVVDTVNPLVHISLHNPYSGVLDKSSVVGYNTYASDIVYNNYNPGAPGTGLSYMELRVHFDLPGTAETTTYTVYMDELAPCTAYLLKNENSFDYFKDITTSRNSSKIKNETLYSNSKRMYNHDFSSSGAFAWEYTASPGETVYCYLVLNGGLNSWETASFKVLREGVQVGYTLNSVEGAETFSLSYTNSDTSSRKIAFVFSVGNFSDGQSTVRAIHFRSSIFGHCKSLEPEGCIHDWAWPNIYSSLAKQVYVGNQYDNLFSCHTSSNTVSYYFFVDVPANSAIQISFVNASIQFLFDSSGRSFVSGKINTWHITYFQNSLGGDKDERLTFIFWGTFGNYSFRIEEISPFLIQDKASLFETRLFDADNSINTLELNIIYQFRNKTDIGTFVSKQNIRKTIPTYYYILTLLNKYAGNTAVGYLYCYDENGKLFYYSDILVNYINYAEHEMLLATNLRQCEFEFFFSPNSYNLIDVSFSVYQVYPYRLTGIESTADHVFQDSIAGVMHALPRTTIVSPSSSSGGSWNSGNMVVSDQYGNYSHLFEMAPAENRVYRFHLVTNLTEYGSKECDYMGMKLFDASGTTKLRETTANWEMDDDDVFYYWKGDTDTATVILAVYSRFSVEYTLPFSFNITVTDVTSSTCGIGAVDGHATSGHGNMTLPETANLRPESPYYVHPGAYTGIEYDLESGVSGHYYYIYVPSPGKDAAFVISIFNISLDDVIPDHPNWYDDDVNYYGNSNNNNNSSSNCTWGYVNGSLVNCTAFANVSNYTGSGTTSAPTAPQEQVNTSSPYYRVIIEILDDSAEENARVIDRVNMTMFAGNSSPRNVTMTYSERHRSTPSSSPLKRIVRVILETPPKKHKKISYDFELERITHCDGDAYTPTGFQCNGIMSGLPEYHSLVLPGYVDFRYLYANLDLEICTSSHADNLGMFRLPLDPKKQYVFKIERTDGLGGDYLSMQLYSPGFDNMLFSSEYDYIIRDPVAYSDFVYESAATSENKDSEMIAYTSRKMYIEDDSAKEYVLLRITTNHNAVVSGADIKFKLRVYELTRCFGDEPYPFSVDRDQKLLPPETAILLTTDYYEDLFVATFKNMRWPGNQVSTAHNFTASSGRGYQFEVNITSPVTWKRDVSFVLLDDKGIALNEIVILSGTVSGRIAFEFVGTVQDEKKKITIKLTKRPPSGDNTGVHWSDDVTYNITIDQLYPCLPKVDGTLPLGSIIKIDPNVHYSGLVMEDASYYYVFDYENTGNQMAYYFAFYESDIIFLGVLSIARYLQNAYFNVKKGEEGYFLLRNRDLQYNSIFIPENIGFKQSVFFRIAAFDISDRCNYMNDYDKASTDFFLDYKIEKMINETDKSPPVSNLFEFGKYYYTDVPINYTLIFQKPKIYVIFMYCDCGDLRSASAAFSLWNNSYNSMHTALSPDRKLMKYLAGVDGPYTLSIGDTELDNPMYFMIEEFYHEECDGLDIGALASNLPVKTYYDMLEAFQQANQGGENTGGGSSDGGVLQVAGGGGGNGNNNGDSGDGGNNDNNNGDDNKSSLSAGAIAGIVVGSLAAAAAVIYAGIVYFRVPVPRMTMMMSTSGRKGGGKRGGSRITTTRTTTRNGVSYIRIED